jgi:hypothetical protein
VDPRANPLEREEKDKKKNESEEKKEDGKIDGKEDKAAFWSILAHLHRARSAARLGGDT